MRNCLLLISAMSLAFLASAQEASDYEYHPYLKNGKVWVYEQEVRDYSNGDGSKRIYSYTQEGLVNMDGNSCANLTANLIQEAEFEDYRDNLNLPEIQNIVCFEEGRTIFLVDELGCNKFLDFNFTTGEAFLKPYEFNPQEEIGISLEVIADEIICIKGSQYRRLTIKRSEYVTELDYWVEGIGCRGYLDMMPFKELPNCQFGVTNPTLTEVYEDGELIFEYDDFTTDNVVAGVSLVNEDRDTKMMGIYDMLGRRLEREPERGMYIVNGRKVVK